MIDYLRFAYSGWLRKRFLSLVVEFGADSGRGTVGKEIASKLFSATGRSKNFHISKVEANIRVYGNYGRDNWCLRDGIR